MEQYNTVVPLIADTSHCGYHWDWPHLRGRYCTLKLLLGLIDYYMVNAVMTHFRQQIETPISIAEWSNNHKQQRHCNHTHQASNTEIDIGTDL